MCCLCLGMFETGCGLGYDMFLQLLPNKFLSNDHSASRRVPFSKKHSLFRDSLAPFPIQLMTSGLNLLPQAGLEIGSPQRETHCTALG